MPSHTNRTALITGGTGVGQSSIIVGNDATSLSLGRALATALDATSTFEIIRYDAMAISSVFVNVIDNDAAGVVITEKNIRDNLIPSAVQQLDDVRGYVNRGLSLRWLLWVLVLMPLIAIGFIGGRGWAGRLKWAGGVATVCALIV